MVGFPITFFYICFTQIILIGIHLIMTKKASLILFLTVLIFGCTNSTYKQIYPVLTDGKYDSEFPYKSCSAQLEEISKSVKKLNCYVEYDIYKFSFEENTTNDKLSNLQTLLTKRPDSSIVEAGFGTATIIHADYQKQVLLTCAHVLDYDDTVFTYYNKSNNKEKRVLAELSIKKRQQNFLKDGADISQFEIIEMDEVNDIALLSGKVSDNLRREPRVINYPAGSSRELQWGDFVYIMGFPSGVQMVTKGIVSKSASNKNVFLIDALFNKGFSGGIVLAVRDGVPNFEIVGMVQSASATYKNILVPIKQSHENIYDNTMEYSDGIYADIDKRINYGVTYATSIESILDFYKKRKKSLEDYNDDLDTFFKQD